MSAVQLQIALLKKDIEHEAGQVTELAERIEGRRDASTTTVDVFNEVVETLKATRGLLMQLMMNTLKQGGGVSGSVGYSEDDDDGPF